jgi:ferredoxin-NADP reductase
MNTTSALNIAGSKPLQFPIPANVYAETVVSVKHYTDRLFSFRITRPQSLRFRSGEFVMIGLPNAEKPIIRAYSVASPAWDDELFGPLLQEKLLYYPTVTREPFRNRGRITDLITSNQLFDDLHQGPLDIDTDRIMMCGSPAMLEELKQLFETRGFAEGANHKPGHFVIEKAFVER